MSFYRSIVVIGAGFGGLRAAKLLAKNYRVTLVDQRAYHTYTPLLYEAATTFKETANYQEIKDLVAYSIEELVEFQSINFIHSEVRQLDLINGDVHCANGVKLKFDYLILALGSEVNYFGIPGLAENSLPLKTFIDALKIREKVLELTVGRERVRIIIGGGGSTGVELAGELKVWLGDKLSIGLVEAASEILPGFSEGVVSKIRRRLNNLQITLLTGSPIDKVGPGKLFLKNGRELECDLLIWTGGVKAPSMIANLPLKLESMGRVEVAGKMECLPQNPDLRLYGKVYAIGDMVCRYDSKTGKPVPGTARAAIEQAGIAAYNIDCDIKEIRLHKEYLPWNYPYIIPVGGKYAVAKIGKLVISGFFGWVAKGLVEFYYLLTI
ncbi:MAG: FAD-dependent oxidoreductase, partial [Patescibacteria group bacterium]